MEELENTATAKLPVTKIIGVGEYGETAVRYINANLFGDVDFDEENRTLIKFAFSDVRVSPFVTKAILADADIVIVIADERGEEAATEIAANAKSAKKLSVLLSDAINDKLTACCDCALEIKSLSDAVSAVSVVLNPCYCIGVIGIDWEDITRQLTEAKRGYILSGVGETVLSAIDDAMSKADATIVRDASVALLDAVVGKDLIAAAADSVRSIEKALRNDCEVTFNVLPSEENRNSCKINIILADC